MEKVHEQDLLYSKEHFSCVNYLGEIKLGFRYRVYEKDCKISRDATFCNVIYFVLEGSMRLSCNAYSTRVISAGEMFFIPVKSFFTIECLTEVKAIVLLFDNADFRCSQFSMRALKPYAEHVHYDFNTLEITKPLKQYLDLLGMYLRNGVNCIHLHKVKADELFILLRQFYSKEKLASLFYPIIGNRLDFRMYCFNMLNDAKGVKELVDKSNMGRSVFYEKFKEEFGDISPKRWLDQHLMRKIFHAASKPDVSVKEMAYQLGFDSESSFCQYCKRHYNLTPTEIIQRQAGTWREV